MRFMMSFNIPIERGNVLLRGPQNFGKTMGEIIAYVNAENAWFS